MTEFVQQDLKGARFDDVYLTGASFHDVELDDATFRMVTMRRTRIRDAVLQDMVIDAERIRHYLIQLMPFEWQPQMVRATERIGERLGAWSRGETIPVVSAWQRLQIDRTLPHRSG